MTLESPICHSRIFIFIVILIFSYPEKLSTVNVQNVGLKVNLRYYQVITEMRNLGAICVITSLQWTNSKRSYSANSASFFSSINSEI
jgi:hypothetical protein